MNTILNNYFFIGNRTMYIILFTLFFTISCTDGLYLYDKCQIIDPTLVKEGVKYQDCDGQEKVGTMAVKKTTTEVDDTIYSLCTKSNQTDCIVMDDFRSIELSDINPNNFKSEFSILGIDGNISECSSDNESECITNSRFTSINGEFIPYSGLLSSGSILGVNGNINTCVVGESNCYTSESFKAVESERLIASNIKNTVSLGGVEGSYGFNNCNAVNHTECIAVESYPSVPSDMVSSYLINNDTLSTYGLSGSISSCNGTTTKTGCYVDGEVVNLLAIDTTNITSENIKYGVSINGVSGSLFHISDENISKLSLTADAFSDMGSISYPVGTEFVWFDKSGAERTGTIPANLQAKNIKKGTGVLGVTGSYSGIKPKIHTNKDHWVGAFSILNTNGSVVSGGDDGIGGVQQYWDQNKSEYIDVSSRLKFGIKEIYFNSFAFAALKDDGSVITWGNYQYGGDSSSPTGGDLSSGVIAIFPNGNLYGGAFAALKSNGSVVTWGDSSYGGNFTYSNGSVTKVPDGSLSSGVKEIYSNKNGAFAALKNNGSVVTWGNSYRGGNSSSLTGGSLSSGVVRIYHNSYAFAALKSDGSVVTWGDSSYGGNFTYSNGSVTKVPDGALSSGVVKIFSTEFAFAALKEGGSVVTWGGDSYGGNSSPEKLTGGNLNSGVVSIYSTYGAFAALKEGGSVVTWGEHSYGGDSSDPVGGSLSSGVVSIHSTGSAFAALKSDGSVVTWGGSSSGGNFLTAGSGWVQANGSLSSGVVSIHSAGSAFAALKSDGSVITWGSSSYGGDPTNTPLDHTVSSELTNIIDIKGGCGFFIAIREDGSYVSWGNYVVL